MRHCVLMVCACGAMAGAAMGQPAELDVGSIDLLKDGSTSFTFDVMENFQAIAFGFEGDYTDDEGGGAWGSDLIMMLTAPDGDTVQIGGFNDPMSDLEWDFDGAGSDMDGFYTSGPHAGYIDSPALGTWQVVFTADEFGPAVWDNIIVTLYAVPAPGAAALLGVGGLAVMRRRR